MEIVRIGLIFKRIHCNVFKERLELVLTSYTKPCRFCCILDVIEKKIEYNKKVIYSKQKN